jgi:hypothetical protein
MKPVRGFLLLYEVCEAYKKLYTVSNVHLTQA